VVDVTGCQLWTVQSNQNSDGGTLHSADNVPDCKQTCVNNKNCKAIDFNHKDMKCFLHYDKVEVKPHKDTDHYVLDRSCKGACLLSVSAY